MITTTSYYHLKHYGELPVNTSTGEWLKKLSNKKEESRSKLSDLISKVKESEINKLNYIFSSVSPDEHIN